jgi:hypothetical protein
MIKINIILKIDFNFIFITWTKNILFKFCFSSFPKIIYVIVFLKKCPIEKEISNKKITIMSYTKNNDINKKQFNMFQKK